MPQPLVLLNYLNVLLEDDGPTITTGGIADPEDLYWEASAELTFLLESGLSPQALQKHVRICGSIPVGPCMF